MGRVALWVIVGVIRAPTVWAQDEGGDGAADASADGAADASAEAPRPWAEGVNDEDQKAALELFEQGNQDFIKQAYVEAADTYRKAILRWKHPAIQYNLSECLIHMDKPMGAYEQVVESLRFGAAPLGDDVFKRAQTRKKLLEGQLALIRVKSGHQGVKVILDGQTVFIAPGQSERRVRPGPHTLVAAKSGFMTYNKELLALPDQPLEVNIELQSLKDIKYERRFPQWVPWTVGGVGLAAAITGIALQVKANGDMDDYDDGIAEQCPSGCPRGDVSSSILDKKDTAELHSTIGVSMIAVGGAALASGVVLLVLNQPKKVGEDNKVKITPAVTPGGAGVSFAMPF